MHTHALVCALIQHTHTLALTQAFTHTNTLACVGTVAHMQSSAQNTQHTHTRIFMDAFTCMNTYSLHTLWHTCTHAIICIHYTHMHAITHKHLQVCTLVHICTHLHMHRPTYTHVMTLTRTHKNSGSLVLWQDQLCPPSPIQAILFPSLDFEFQLPPIPYLSPLSGQLVVSP